MAVSSDSPITAAAPPKGRSRLGPHRAPPPQVLATDGELLAQFKRHGDRAALDRLVDRHSAMVWRVCRATLRRPQDVEDAFQATFLLLIKNARSIKSSDTAAGWLYRVAYRTSLRARKKLSSRREEALAVDPLAPSEAAFPDLLQKQTTGVLVEELMRLPAKYQAPLVLRYLEGQSRRAIAEQTDTTIAAVQGRLARGKQLLRRRLLRRGVSLAAAMGALGLGARGAAAAENAPARVLAQTTSNSAALAGGGSLAASSAVTVLYRQGVNAMFMAWLSKPAAATTAVAIIATLFFTPTGGGALPVGYGAEPAIIAALHDEGTYEESAPIHLAQDESPESHRPQPLEQTADKLVQKVIPFANARDPRLGAGEAANELAVSIPVDKKLSPEVRAEQLRRYAENLRSTYRQLAANDAVQTKDALIVALEKERVGLEEERKALVLQLDDLQRQSIASSDQDRKKADAQQRLLSSRVVQLVAKREQIVERLKELATQDQSTPPSAKLKQPASNTESKPTLAYNDRIEASVWGGDSEHSMAGELWIDQTGALLLTAEGESTDSIWRKVEGVGGMTLQEAARHVAQELRKRTGDTALRVRLSHKLFGVAGNEPRPSSESKPTVPSGTVGRMKVKVGEPAELSIHTPDKNQRLRLRYEPAADGKTATIDLLESIGDAAPEAVESDKKSRATHRPERPVVVKTIPPRGATEVDPGLTEVRFTFDRDMYTGGYSFSGSALNKQAKPEWIDPRTCVVPVWLGPGQDHRLIVNAPGRENTRSAEGVPAKTDELRFRTRSLRPGEPTNDDGLAAYQYGPDSKIKQGQWNCLHRPSALNPKGWATIAELNPGEHAPMMLPDDERPRPHLRYDAWNQSNGQYTHHFTVEDPSSDDHGKMIESSAEAGDATSVRGQSIEVIGLSKPAKNGPTLVLIRGRFDENPLPTIEEAKRLLYPNRNLGSRVTYRYPIGSTQSGGVSQSHYEPTELNPHGWVALAHGAPGVAVSVVLPGGATPNPKLRLLPNSTDEWAQLRIEHEGDQRHLEEIAVKRDEPRLETIAGQRVQVWYRSIPAESPTTSPRLLLIARGFPKTDQDDAGIDRLPAPSAEAAMERLYRSTTELVARKPPMQARQVGLVTREYDVKDLFRLIMPPFGGQADAIENRPELEGLARHLVEALTSDDKSLLKKVEAVDGKLALTVQAEPGAQARTLAWLENAIEACRRSPTIRNEFYQFLTRSDPDPNDRRMYGGFFKVFISSDWQTSHKSWEESLHKIRVRDGQQPVAKRPAGRVDYTDGKADGKKSLGGSGHLIKFELPEGAVGVKSVRVHGSRYGTKTAPREDFEISFLSEDRSEILDIRRGAYGLFRRGAEKWTNVRFKDPVVDLPKTFWVAIDFNPGRTKGVYLSYDTSTGGERSMTGLAQQEPGEHKPVDFGGDWMVSVVLERADTAALKTEAEVTQPVALTIK